MEHNSGLKKLYFQLQAKRMAEYEGEVCRAVRKVVAVSEGDAEAMRREYGVERVYAAPTGVDLDYFARPDGGEKLGRYGVSGVHGLDAEYRWRDVVCARSAAADPRQEAGVHVGDCGKAPGGGGVAPGGRRIAGSRLRARFPMCGRGSSGL